MPYSSSSSSSSQKAGRPKGFLAKPCDCGQGTPGHKNATKLNGCANYREKTPTAQAAQFTTSSFDVTYTAEEKAIGISFNWEGVFPIVVVNPVTKGGCTGASLEAGVIPGDTIAAVNGLDVRTMTWEGMLNHLRVMPVTVRFVRSATV